MSNTHPNTIFGKFFNKVGIWHPTVWETIGYVIKNKKDVEDSVIAEVEGWLNNIKATLEAIPAFVLETLKVDKEDVEKAIKEIEAVIEQVKAVL
jgi:flavodoxin